MTERDGYHPKETRIDYYDDTDPVGPIEILLPLQEGKEWYNLPEDMVIGKVQYEGLWRIVKLFAIHHKDGVMTFSLKYQEVVSGDFNCRFDVSYAELQRINPKIICKMTDPTSKQRRNIRLAIGSVLLLAAAVSGFSIFLAEQSPRKNAQGPRPVNKKKEETNEEFNKRLDDKILAREGDYVRKAEIYYNRKQYDKALEQCELAIEHAKRNDVPFLYFFQLKASILEAKGDVQSAIDVLENEARTMKVLIRPEPYGSLARLYKKLGNEKRAQDYEKIYERISYSDFADRERLEDEIRMLLGVKKE